MPCYDALELGTNNEHQSKPHVLNLPFNSDFSNAGIYLDVDDSSTSCSSVTYQDEAANEFQQPPVDPPPPQPPPEPPPSFDSSRKTISSLIKSYDAFISSKFLNYSPTLNTCKGPLTHDAHCDYILESNDLLSELSPTTRDHYYDHLIFPNEKPVCAFQLLTQQ